MLKRQTECRLWIAICLMWSLTTAGCVAQQADLKSTERRLKQSNEELAQRGAQQRQELEALKGEEIPKLRGELERAMNKAQEIQSKQEDLEQRSAVLRQQTTKLEQLAAKLETDSASRYAQVRESLNAQDMKNKTDRDQLRGDVNTRLDEINRQMEALRKDIIDAVQKTNAALVKSVDTRLDEQRKETQTRAEQLSGKFTQYSQALTGFKESLTALGERVSQEEQANKALAAKLEADTRASSAHINETTKVMTGHLNEVNKSVASAAQKIGTRLDEQMSEMNAGFTSSMHKLSARLEEHDRRIDSLSKSLDQVSQEVHVRGAGKNSQRQQAASPGHRSSVVPTPTSSSVQEAAAQPERDTALAADPEPVKGQPLERPVPAEPVEDQPRPAVSRPVERPDKTEYERLLAVFREGDLDSARRGFASFLNQYPNSEFAPNARYWLGESHYGKKDYKLAIDAYDRVETDYPQSEKVPAAILKKGYAYLALKDKKRASSAFKQVVTLYPKSLEAGKANDKLAQLKESR